MTEPLPRAMTSTEVTPTRTWGRRLLLALAALPLAAVLYVASAVIHFPAVLRDGREQPRESAMMRLRAREAQRDGRSWTPRYSWIPLSEIPTHLVQAVLAGEDAMFYQHQGFDVPALYKAWETGDPRGTSTITQQTVKNLYLSPARSAPRKLKEALLTWWMELWLPKNRILELYLNVVELGPGIFGVEAASQLYFGTSAALISREQSALLVASLPAPLRSNPASPSRGLLRRQRTILYRMDRWYESADLFTLE